MGQYPIPVNESLASGGKIAENQRIVRTLIAHFTCRTFHLQNHLYRLSHRRRLAEYLCFKVSMATSRLSILIPVYFCSSRRSEHDLPAVRCGDRSHQHDLAPASSLLGLTSTYNFYTRSVNFIVF